MRSKFKKILTYFLLSAIILPGWILGSSLFQKPEIAQAATIGAGGGATGNAIIDGTGTSFPLNPFMITSNVAGDITAVGDVTISIVGNTAANLQFDTAPASIEASVVPSGSILTVASPITPIANQITVDVTNNSGAGESLIVSNIKLKASAGATSDFVGTAKLKTETAGGTIYGDIINVDAQLPAITSAETQDINTNGQLDAVKINFSENIDDSTVLTANFGIVGYVNPAFASTTNGDVADNDYIYLTFDESVVPDTQAIPNLTYTAGTLADLAGNLLGTIVMGTTDKAVPAKPTNLSGVVANGQINLSWDASINYLDIAGYNVYRNDNGYSAPINPALVVGTIYNDVPGSNGNYDYKVEAIDMAGNVSAQSTVSNQVNFMAILPPAPANITTSTSNHTLTVSWDAVGGGVTGYIVTIGGVSVDVGNVNSYSTDLDYGTYKVLVTSYYSVSNYGINDSAGLNEVKNAAIAVGLEKSVTLASVVKTSNVSKVSIVPEPAVAVETPVVTSPADTSVDEGVETDDSGQIKGEEENTDQAEEKINWTPWIILFVLIILAGAATGGYFYWFAGEEEVETKIKTKPEVEKKEITKPKAKDTSGKKPRRW